MCGRYYLENTIETISINGGIITSDENKNVELSSLVSSLIPNQAVSATQFTSNKTITVDGIVIETIFSKCTFSIDIVSVPS